MSSLIIRSERVALPDGLRPAAVQVLDGRIVGIAPHREPSTGVRELDVGAFVLLPGLVDTHVHINDPGRADWEGFDSATRAAAAGGVTTLVDMPLNSIPPTTTLAGLHAKRDAANGRCHVDVAFWGGVVPGNAAELEPLAQAGVLGFKCFLSPSGVPEFENVTESDLGEALPILARHGLPLLVHAELPALLRDPAAGQAGRTAGRDSLHADPRSYRAWLDSRPIAAEVAAIELMIRLARAHSARVHIVHLGTAAALPQLSAARRDGVAITVETCPHYLTFAAEEIPDGSPAYKCAPPIREQRERESLWKGLAAGDIDLVATDHSPSPPALKHLDDGDNVRAWGGIASLQLGLAALWTGMSTRGLPIERLADWLARGPAALAGLDRVKGAIAVGHDADLVVWDPEATCTVDGASLFHRHPVTPYHGARLRGRVKATFLRGEIVFEDGRQVGGARGRLLTRAIAG
jgi:allantoinase